MFCLHEWAVDPTYPKPIHLWLINIQWISEKTWTYWRSFQVTDDLLMHRHLLLRCEGLDTLATVIVNGNDVGKTDNMFRTWKFDMKSHLKPGDNSIEVRFDPVLPLIRAKE